MQDVALDLESEGSGSISIRGIILSLDCFVSDSKDEHFNVAIFL